MSKPILIVSRWPSIPGHGGGTEAVSGYRRAVSADGEWWLVREKGFIGFLRRWEWLPVNGAHVTMQETNEEPTDD